MNRETGWNAYPSTRILLLLRERPPFRPMAHKVLRQNQATVLAYRLSLFKVLDKVQTAAFGAEMDL